MPTTTSSAYRSQDSDWATATTTSTTTHGAGRFCRPDKAYRRRLFAALRYDQAKASDLFEKVYAIQKRIAGVSYHNVKLRDINANYHKMSYDQLVRHFPASTGPRRRTVLPS